MSRKEYMDELTKKLVRMPEQERMEAISYYEEYFDEAGEENEEDVIKSLGTPTQVARQILADFAVKESAAKPQSPKKGIWAIVLIVLAILASPIAFPLALVAIILVFVAVLLVGIFIFTGVIIVFAMGVGGFTSLIASAAIFAASPATGIFCLGIGISFVGVALLFGALVYEGIVRGVPVFIKGMNSGFNRINRRRG